MRSVLYQLAIVVTVCTAFAIAQTTSPNAPGSRQQMPNAPGQRGPVGQYPPSSTQPGATQTGPTSTGTEASDVQSRIQSAFQQDPSLATSNISVNVSGNKVELSGNVPSRADKDRAHSIAEQNAGGLKIVDHIKVSGKEKSTPPSKY